VDYSPEWLAERMKSEALRISVQVCEESMKSFAKEMTGNEKTKVLPEYSNEVLTAYLMAMNTFLKAVHENVELQSDMITSMAIIASKGIDPTTMNWKEVQKTAKEIVSANDLK
jgi:hypothetical protein